MDKLAKHPLPCFNVQISSGPLMCIQMINEQLWCASGNKVTILNPQTMDTIDQFFISSNIMDIISKMVENDYGVWITIRGSSIVQVWDPSALICKMMFDTRDHKYPHGSKDDDNYNPLRVTSLLPFNNSLWIGTADGTLLIFDISNRLINKTVVDSSPHHEKTQNIIDDFNSVSQDQQAFVPVFNDDSDEKNDQVLPTPKPVRDRSDSGYQTVGLDFMHHRQSWDCNGSVNADNCSSTTVRGSSSMEFSPRTSCDATNTCCQFSFNNAYDCYENSAHNDSANVIENGLQEQTLVENGEVAVSNCCTESVPKLQGTFPKSVQMPNRRHSLAAPDVGLLQPLNELSVSTSDGGDSFKNSTAVNNCNGVESGPQKVLQLHGSFDSVSHLLTGSHESVLSSSIGDNYEYEDVFIAYTEDERSLSAEPRLGNPIETGVRYAEELMKSFQLPLTKTKATKNHPKKSVTQTKCSQRRCLDSYKANSSSDLNHNHVKLSPRSKKKGRSIVDAVDNVAVNKEGKTEPHRQWSSFDDLSAPSNVEYDSLQDSQPQMDYLKLTTNMVSPMSKSSDSGSYVSFASSDVPYMLELTMKEKIKIADQPIKVLLAVRCNKEAAIISCSGSCRDDESVLKWTVEGEEQLWTNDPIVEVCPYTNKVKPSAYVRSRLPRRSSSIVSSATIVCSENSNSSHEESKKQDTSTTRSRVQSLFAAITSDK